MCHSSLSGHIRDILAHIFTLVAFMLRKLARKIVYLRVRKTTAGYQSNKNIFNPCTRGGSSRLNLEHGFLYLNT